MHEAGSRLQRFAVLSQLGGDRVSSMLRAHDTRLDRDVSIKLLNIARGSVPNLSEPETIDLRRLSTNRPDDLLREARAMARLSHPNVLPVYEIGLADDAVFVVMEHCDGADLRTWLPGKRRREILDALTQAACGLQAAHERGIAHGDFKPDNVLVGSDGRVRVAAFGLGQLSGGAEVTSRYVAPELALTGQPTLASDVYAFCATAVEVLGGDRDDIEHTLPVPRRLRKTIATGLSADPHWRPSLATILAALEHRGSALAWWFVPIALGCAFGGVAVGALSGERDDCTVDHSLGGWNVARSIALRAKLSPGEPSSSDSAWLAQIDRRFGDQQHEIDVRRVATCRAEHRHELTAAQAEIRHSCLSRRQIELDAKIDLFATSRGQQLAKLVQRSQIPDVADCDEIATAPLPHDLAPIVSLYRRVVDSEQLPLRDRAAAMLVLERDADLAGERELSVRAILLAGAWSSEIGKLDEADVLLQRGYNAAVAISSSRLQLKALTMRVRREVKRGNAQAAIALGKLVETLADRATMPVEARARAYAELGTAAYERSDPDVALAVLDKGLAVIAADGHRLPNIEASLRIDRVRTLGRFQDKRAETLAAAKETATWMSDTFGERSTQAATGLEILAGTQQWNNDVVGALATYERGYAIDYELKKGDPTLVLTRAELARLYEANGRFEEARVIYEEVLAASEHNEPIQAFLPLLQVHLGTVSCEVRRCEEGYPMIERGIEAGIAQYGADHHYVLEYRTNLMEVQIALGLFESAQRTLTTIRRRYETDPVHYGIALTLLDDAEARITLGRGSRRGAEQMARAALGRAEQLHSDSVLMSSIHATIGDALIAQRRWPEAKQEIDDSISLARKANLPVHAFDEHEIRLAQIEAGLGDLAGAKERARRVRPSLTYLSREFRKRADALIARKR